jgi:predicted Fe-S protein YdhL (DUF1289 family)
VQVVVVSSSNSPCVSVCELDIHTQTCTACNRTMEQIENWMHYSKEQRKAIMKEIKRGRK